MRPTNKPTVKPDNTPGKDDNTKTTAAPTLRPTFKPSKEPTEQPTSEPTTFAPTVSALFLEYFVVAPGLTSLDAISIQFTDAAYEVLFVTEDNAISLNANNDEDTEDEINVRHLSHHHRFIRRNLQGGDGISVDDPPSADDPEDPPSIDGPEDPPSVDDPEDPPSVDGPEDSPSVDGPEDPLSIDEIPSLDATDDFTTDDFTTDDSTTDDTTTPEVPAPEVTPVIAFVPGTSEYDQNVVKIKSLPVPATCTAEYGENIEEGKKCIQVFMEIDSVDNDLSNADLNQIGFDITSTVESGVFQDILVIGGLDVVVLVPPLPALTTATPTVAPTTIEPTSEPTVGEPTAGPTITSEPTVGPSTKPVATPTVEPTIKGDPCPDLTDNCAACVSSAECLWCRGEDICFNSSPEIAEASRQALLSDEDAADSNDLFEKEVCSGTVTGSLLVCNLPPVEAPVVVFIAPSAPTEAPVTFIAQDSGGSSLYSSSNNVLMNTIMSCICMTMLLLYRH